MIDIVRPASVAALEALLDEQGYDHSKWGTTPGTKTVQALFEEQESRESGLGFDGGKLFRLTTVVQVTVESNDGKKVLIEFFRKKDGKASTRLLAMKSSLGEKVGPDDISQHDAAVRALKEELNISTGLGSFSPNGDQFFEDKDSGSFPNLPTRYSFVPLSIVLDTVQSERTQFVEMKNGRSTFFVWVPKFVAEELWASEVKA
jgi:hypothetical protein